MQRRNFIGGAIATGLAPLPFASFAADPYPNRAVRLIVGWSAGGATDTMSRIVGEDLGKELGQVVVVDNRPGAAGTLAMEQLRHVTPDGYTLMAVEGSAVTISPHIYKTIKYDVFKDYQYIGQIAKIPLLLVVNGNLPVNSLAQFIEHVKANPDKVRYASAGVGSPLHLPMELFQRRTGVSMLHVPYKGSAPAVQDLLTGQVDAMIVDVSTINPHVKGGKIRPLAMATDTRNAQMPDVPTFKELGVPDFDVVSWVALVAPRGLDPQIVQRISAALRTSMAKPAVQDRLRTMGLDPNYTDAATMERIVRNEREQWGKIIADKNIKAE